MLSYQLLSKLFASIFVLVIASMPSTVAAQSVSLKTLSMEEFSNLERVRQSSELAPVILRSLESFKPTNFYSLPGRIKRLTLKEEVERDGKIVRTSTKTIESVVGQPGYYSVRGKATIPELGDFWTSSYEVYFLNLWQVAGRHHTESKPRIGSDSISDTTGYLAELTLQASFEDALAPGANWSYEKTYESENARFQGVETRKSGSLKYVAEVCSTGQGSLASDLHPKLSGMLIPIQCQSKSLAIGGSFKVVYLKDYGFFIPIERHHVSETPMPLRFTSRYSIVDVEFDPLITKSN